MKRLFVLLYLAILALARFALPSATADELSLSPQRGFVLLNNGNVIEATITAAGDRYDIVREGSVTQLKRAEVAAVCRTLEECYQFKRGAIELGRVQDHVELAQWCLWNRLFDQAEKEIADARRADPEYPKIQLVARRLQLAKEEPQKPPANASSEKRSPHEQLDRTARNLPAGSMELFTNTIQPLLLNYCTRAGCHGPQSTNGLRLERISLSKTTGRHVTHRNLQAALSLVDPGRPEESKLLQAPIRAHGTARLPIFSDREQSQYKQLVQWVYLVSGARSVQSQRSLEERGAPLLQTMSRDPQPATPPLQHEPPPLDAAAPQLPAELDANEAPPVGSLELPSGQALRAVRERGQVVLRPALKRGDEVKTFVPRDAFDPELFNRRYFGP